MKGQNFVGCSSTSLYKQFLGATSTTLSLTIASSCMFLFFGATRMAGRVSSESAMRIGNSLVRRTSQSKNTVFEHHEQPELNPINRKIGKEVVRCTLGMFSFRSFGSCTKRSKSLRKVHDSIKLVRSFIKMFPEFLISP